MAYLSRLSWEDNPAARAGACVAGAARTAEDGGGGSWAACPLGAHLEPRMLLGRSPTSTMASPAAQ